ncbi:Vitamin B12 import ATP-binding protein BtuD [Paenibacillus sp. CECT 9249]|uniref:ABC transporter ATP-binding protein n=1 Tax=Paenibacillus sp. CECT 9249 TaxID=2845385 RepID=UPI001E53697B|nr:ABC transporter ATP-binding protein [Paenibacillus sp. CECT 9249]CAH0121915.1 Vitamin B12 import ATP-binding protein BtuD [Paenibacillus sp. CECT 9249]
MKPILEVKGLSKSLGSFRLQDVSFFLTEGCITGFIGVNGAGKTTTIKLILGLIAKDAGDIAFRGKDILSNEREFKNRIGIVLDEGYFYDELTLLEMKSVIAPAYSDWDDAVFRRHIERFGLPLSQPIGTLSKGMRMKYAIALAMSHHADLLIMDEPTSGLDPQVRLELMDILLEYVNEDGKSVFLSSHITSDLDKVADGIILIDRGQIVFSEEKDALLDMHGYVKGDTKELNERTRGLFVTLNETGYGFSGLTNDKAAVRQHMKNALIERPTIEDVMLGYIRR